MSKTLQKLREERPCSTCCFWPVDDEPGGPVLGECRLNPPTFNPLPGDPEEADTLAGLPRRPWPITESRDWCAAWRKGHRV